MAIRHDSPVALEAVDESGSQRDYQPGRFSQVIGGIGLAAVFMDYALIIRGLGETAMMGKTMVYALMLE